MQPDEGRNAVIAVEMERTGSWLVPSLLGHAYLDKPAFFFRAVALSLGAFGQSEAAARLPSALAALLVTALTFASVRREAGSRTAAISVAALATMPLFVAFARLVIFDMTLTAFVCAAIFLGHVAEARTGGGRRALLALAAACGGIATLVKGPVGAALPLLIHLAAARANGRRGVLLRALGPAPLLAFTAVVAPWIAGATLRAPAFLEYGVMVESLQRLTDPEFRRNQPIYYYVPLLLGGCLPWSVLVPGGALLAWRVRDRLLPLDRLCLVWTALVVGLFTLSRSKQPAYVISACVPLAVLVARMLDAALSRPDGAAARRSWAGFLVLSLPLAFAAAATLAVALDPALLAHWPDLEGPRVHVWVPAFAEVAAIGAVFVGVVIAARVTRRLGAAVAAVALLIPALLVAVAPAFAGYAEARSSRLLSGQIAALPEGTEIVCLRFFPSALPFYRDDRVVLVSDDASELRSNYVPWALARGGPRPPALVHPDTFPAWLASRRGPVYLLASDDMRKTLVAIAAERGVPVTQLAPRRWGALLPAPTGS